MKYTYATASDFKRRQVNTMAQFHTRQLATIMNGLNMPKCDTCGKNSHIVNLHGDNPCEACSK